MPRRYTKKKRKFYRGRKYTNNNLLTSPNSLFGFPSNKVVKMRYCTTVSINPPAAGVGTYVFRANDIHDPDASFGGHQASGHDEWNLFYNHKVVLGSKIRAEFFYTSATTATDLLVGGIYLADDGTIPSTLDSIIEQGMGVSKSIAAYPQSSAASTKLQMTFSAKKFFNCSDVKDRLDTLGSSFGSSPSEQAMYHVWVGTNGAGDPPSLGALITIDYIVLLSEPKSLTQS